MKQKKHTNKQGFTLVECLVVMLILLVAFSGIVGFRYYSILSAERAEMQLLVSRAAVVISETWRAQKGVTDFDPTQQGFDQDFTIQLASGAAFVSAIPSGTQLLGNYEVDIAGRQIQTQLVYEDSADVPNARLLYVVMSWLDRKQLRQQFSMATLTQTRI